MMRLALILLAAFLLVCRKQDGERHGLEGQWQMSVDIPVMNIDRIHGVTPTDDTLTNVTALLFRDVRVRVGASMTFLIDTTRNEDTLLDLTYAASGDTLTFSDPLSETIALMKYRISAGDSLTLIHVGGDTLWLTSFRPTLQGIYLRD